MKLPKINRPLYIKSTNYNKSTFNRKQKEQLKAVNEEVKKVDINNIVSIDEISKGAIYNKRYSVLMATSNKKILNYTIVEKRTKRRPI